MTVEIMNEHPGPDGIFYANLDLPAMDYEIHDVSQRLRGIWQKNRVREASVLNCSLFPSLVGVRMGSPTLDELNFFAKRLDSLSEEEQLVFRAASQHFLSDNPKGEFVSIKDLINCTYGLDQVMIASNVANDEQLGQFVIENNLHEDVADVPDNARYLLDKNLIGKIQRGNDSGIFIDGFYVAVGDYELPETYNGRILPEKMETTEYIFRLRLSGNETDDPHDQQEWINLPLTGARMKAFKEAHGKRDITDFYCHAFLSVIPQLQFLTISHLQDFDMLNTLAQRIAEMDSLDHIIFKSALFAEQTDNVSDAMDIAAHLHEYEISYANSAGSFFKDYLSNFMINEFDCVWLNTLSAQNGGKRLLERIGATETPYGIISTRGCSLYDPISYDESELTLQDMTDEKLDVIEVLDRKALFANGRLLPEEIPEGLYAYNLRESDNGDRFISIEPKVGVNHGGTVLMKEILDFGESGFIEFDEDNEPNFLGYTMTPQEFANEEQNQGFGGMRL